MPETCICCGAVIPEGRQICPNCERDTNWRTSYVTEGYPCKACGQLIFPTPDHVYKDSSGLYCCWTCFSHRNDKKKKTKGVEIECFFVDGEHLKTFESAKKAAKWIGTTENTIHIACESGRIIKGYLWRYKT